MTVPTRLDSYGLHRFALLGDAEGILRALQAGADVNSLDDAGRTAVMCVVAGENWRDMDASDALFMTQGRLDALKVLLSRPDISLLTLNAPHASMNGVIPLGVAAWLNQPQVVRSLLDDSAQSVSVDGMDSHGATALMYAARDGNLEVAKILLSRGARPDFRDHNHRTSLQFALPHPSVLYLCEVALRRHRWRESKSADRTRLSADSNELVELAGSSLPLEVHFESPSSSIFTKETTLTLAENLISFIRSSDLSSIQSLLFSQSIAVSPSSNLYTIFAPILVNAPDHKGWSPIHHCVNVLYPSIQILDALYCAGADVSLFTTYEQQTPLHILARSARFDGPSDSSHPLVVFIFHLIQDLRAPISARDKNEETCLHIAAEYGKSLDFLMLLLRCDTSGTVRQMKNSRGLTPEDVCKQEFLLAFRHHTLSCFPTVVNFVQSTESFASLVSSEYDPFGPSINSDTLAIISTSHLEIEAIVHNLLSNLSITSPTINQSKTPVQIRQLKDCIDDASDQCNSVLVHFLARIEEATRVVRDLQSRMERIDSLRNIVALASKGKLLAREITPLRAKRHQRDSEDSQVTYSPERDIPQPFVASSERRPSIGTQTSLLDLVIANPLGGVNNTRVGSVGGMSACGTRLCNIEHELAELKGPSLVASPATMLDVMTQCTLRKLEGKLHQIDQKKQTVKQGSRSKLKAWLKRLIAHHQVIPGKLEVSICIDEEPCNIGQEVKPTSIKPVHNDPLDSTIETALRTSQVVLESALHDLGSISNHLVAAHQFIDAANHSISKVQRLFKRAVKKRDAMIVDLQANSLGSGLLYAAHAVTTRTSLASISTISSGASSGAATVTEDTDDDLRRLRRLLLRKIDAQISGAWDEVDKITVWLHIVKEAVRGVKRRAYL